MDFFELNTRKKITEYVVNYFSNITSFIPNKTVAGWVVVLIHYIFGIIVVNNLLNNPITNSYYIYTIFWVISIFSNYYFHGCIVSKIEQRIFEDKTWCGPINLLLNLFPFIEKSKENFNTILKYYIVAPISIFVIFKYHFSKRISDKIIGVILTFCLTPLLFIHSQFNIFNYLMNATKRSDIVSHSISDINYVKFNNKVIAITGCSSGIGKKLIRDLMNNSNATIILLNRESSHLQKLLSEINIIKVKNNNNIVNIHCDLTDFKSVYEAFKKMTTQFPEGIDVLINNAGICYTNNEITPDGLNNTIQTNFISHALITELFLQMKNKTNNDKPFEIINVSSMAYNIPNKKYDETLFNKIKSLDNQQTYYNSQIYYQQSKLAMVLYAKHLGKEVLKENKNIKIFSLHPGICKTGLFEKSNLPFILKYALNNMFYESDRASKCILQLILNEKVKCHQFYGLNMLNGCTENILDDTLLNNDCSEKLYVKTKQIIEPFLHLGNELGSQAKI